MHGAVGAEPRLEVPQTAHPFVDPVLLVTGVDQTGVWHGGFDDPAGACRLQIAQRGLDPSQCPAVLAGKLAQRFDDPVAVVAKQVVVGDVGLDHLCQGGVEVGGDPLEFFDAGADVLQVDGKQPVVGAQVVEDAAHGVLDAVQQAAGQLERAANVDDGRSDGGDDAASLAGQRPCLLADDHALVAAYWGGVVTERFGEAPLGQLVQRLEQIRLGERVVVADGPQLVGDVRQRGHGAARGQFLQGRQQRGVPLPDQVIR